MNLPALLSFICGFASLSVEILWVRLYGYANQSTPAAFGFVLAAYLVGIALGAKVGARACRRLHADAALWRASLAALLLSAVATPLAPAFYALFHGAGVGNPALDMLPIACASGLLSFVFPIAHHLGTRHAQDAQGRRFALVYTANVAGAALGPLVTGYVVLDAMSLQDALLLMAALQAAGALLLWRLLRADAPPRSFALRALAIAAMMAVAMLTLESHLLVQRVSAEHRMAKTVVENRHGIIAIYPGHGPDNGIDDVVHGGNVYDGRTNLSPERNSNSIDRPLLAAVLQPQPRRVLVAGLSIGTWLALVREFPGVENIDVVEINPAYLEAAQPYGPQARALRDPRVRLEIDDVRRWLRRHPDKRYDLVVMNTTFHWRANASLLLSQEMMRMVRAHMAPGALLAFNGTSSPDAFYTATRTFAHAWRYGNFIYAADFDFHARKDQPEARAKYAALRLQGVPLFAPDSAAIDHFLEKPFVAIEEDSARLGRPLEEVSDANLITEFKYGRRLYYWLDALFL